MEEKEIISQVYEVGFNFIPSVGDEGSSEEFTKVRSILEDRGAEIISFELPARIGLAYPMDKVIDHKRQSYTEAYFGWIKFEVAREKTEEIKIALDSQEKILRYIIIKTVRENTLAPKKVFAPKVERERKSAAPSAEEPQEINEEEVDRQISALVDEEVTN